MTIDQIVSYCALGIAGWALSKVVSLGEKVASLEESQRNNTRQFDSINATLGTINAKLDRLLLQGLGNDAQEKK